MNENDDTRRIMQILIREIHVNLCSILEGESFFLEPGAEHYSII